MNLILTTVCFVFAVSEVLSECWWTASCQPKSWAQRGCFPENEWRIERVESCGDAGDKFYCCRRGGGGGQPGGNAGAVESGMCSYYGEPGEIPPGHPTASGEPFNAYEMAAAHKTLPFGTRIRVRNQLNGKEVVVRINDRGPFVPGRIVDLTKAAFQRVEDTARGVFPCSYTVV